MPLEHRRRRESNHPKGDSGLRDSYGLIRSTHIFAATVRQALELNLLREVTALPVNLSQLYLLKLMTINGQHQVGEVAEFLGVSPPAATKNIEKLVRLGLINRSPSEGDRRATLLSVSLKGRRLVERYEAMKVERVTPVLELFSTHDLERLRDLMERFSVALLSSASEIDTACLRCAAYLESECAVGLLQGGCRFEDVLPMPKQGGGGRQAWQGGTEQ